MALQRTQTWDAIIAQLEQRILSVTSSDSPSYTVAGRSIQKGEYLQQLMDNYEKALEYRQAADGPFDVVTSFR